MSDPCTCADCNAKANRIAAFGAIRRAVEVARRKDYIAAAFRETHPNHPMAAPEHAAAGNAIRQAIRAAIGSHKA